MQDEQQQLIIDLSGYFWIVEFSPIFLLVAVIVYYRGRRIYDYIMAHSRIARYVKPIETPAPQSAQTAVAGFVQRQIKEYWQGVISEDDITKIIQAREQLLQSGEDYSRKQVCQLAFNSVSSAPYRKTKMVLDKLEEAVVE
jgi:hypothetical protein